MDNTPIRFKCPAFVLSQRLVAILAVLLAVAAAFGQTNAPTWPYRKVEGKYYSIQPILTWEQTMSKRRSGDPSTPQPMRGWLCSYIPEASVWYKIDQIMDAGILAHIGENEPVLIRNFPNPEKLVDGQRIDFIALDVGTFKYTDTLGVVRTVKAYDYGIPYNPREPANQQTNSTAKTNNLPTTNGNNGKSR